MSYPSQVHLKGESNLEHFQGAFGALAAKDPLVLALILGLRLKAKTPFCSHVAFLPAPGVVAGAEPINQHYFLIPDHPRIMSLRNQMDLSCVGIVFNTVGHDYMQTSGNLVLKMGRLAPLGLDYWLHMQRPAPTGLQCKPSDNAPPDVEQINFAFFK